jgi:transcriptional regulator with XRE-family HTH domain
MDDKHILSYVREAIGLKQSELATLAGISTDAIQSIEILRLPLSEKIAFRLEQQLGVRAKWLLDNELGDPPPAPRKSRGNLMRRKRIPGETPTSPT